jgi:2'-5' RNA ligase
MNQGLRDRKISPGRATGHSISWNACRSISNPIRQSHARILLNETKSAPIANGKQAFVRQNSPGELLLNQGKYELSGQYNVMWQESWPRVRSGDITCDPRLADKVSDKRRGLTLIARLEPRVTERLGHVLQTLSGIEPHQYYYPLADIHLTILSLFTATEDYRSYLERLDDYRDTVAAVLKSSHSFLVDSVGVTLSRGAVMLQGFPRDTTLNDLRDHLRSALICNGLGGSLDQRYCLVTAHSTFLRFTSPLQMPEPFCSTLDTFRSEFFGTSAIMSLELVLNDWYMSSENLVKIETHHLRECELTGTR